MLLSFRSRTLIVLSALRALYSCFKTLIISTGWFNSFVYASLIINHSNNELLYKMTLQCIQHGYQKGPVKETIVKITVKKVKCVKKKWIAKLVKMFSWAYAN